MSFILKYKKILSIVLIISIIAPIAFLPTRKVEAQSGLAGCLGALIGIDLISSLFGQEVPVKDYGQNVKDQCMDAIFYIINEIVIKEITKSTIEWINSGFNGNPSYVTDLGKFAEDIADQEFGRLIEGSELNFLCSPFQLEIKKALIINNRRGTDGRFQRGISCRLSEVTSNIENFIGGDFADGGWDAWRVLSEDNPYSNYVRVSAELRARTTSAVANEEKKLDFGRGFLSYEQCDDGTSGNPATNSSGNTSNTPPEQGPNPDGSTVDSKPRCEIVTPGSVIENQLNNTIQSGQRRIEMADEINEIIDAYLAYLVTKVLTKGLRSLSKSNSSGEKSYTDSLIDNNTPAGRDGSDTIIRENPNDFGGGTLTDTQDINPFDQSPLIPPQVQELIDQYGTTTATTTP